MVAGLSLDDDGRDALGQFILALRTRGFRDNALLQAVENAPRGAFLPLPYVGFAYQDLALPIACGQEATSPFAVAEAVTALQVQPHHRVLEVGTGSGWQTAVLAGLAKAVASVERYRGLAEDAERRLRKLGFENAIVALADGAEGLAEGAPFDRIVFNAAIESVGPALQAQLAPDGSLIAPIIEGERQTLMKFQMRGGELVSTPLGVSRQARLIPGIAIAL